MHIKKVFSKKFVNYLLIKNIFIYICITLKQINMNNKIECSFCGHLNHINNIRCEGYDCGIPLDLDIEYQTFNGLPNITNKQ